MTEIIARFEIVTPLFMSGFDQSVPELRLASIKSEIAFWWRAIKFQSYFSAGQEITPVEMHTALDRLHQDECALFGSARDGQGQFLLKLVDCNIDRKTDFQKLNKLNIGAKYLGYGIEGKRSCFEQGEFSVAIKFRKKAPETSVAEICRAMRIFGLLGGLGARKRRGFGSIRLISLTGSPGGHDFAPPSSIEQYQKQIRDAAGKRVVSGRDFPLSAIAAETDIRIWAGDFPNWRDALNALGDEFLMYRSWGSGGMVAGRQSRKNFESDHDWFKRAYCSAANGGHNPDNWNQRNARIPERANFGLPHNYFKSHPGGKNLKLEIKPNADWERRASPLLFHITKIGNKFVPVAIHFANKFLPSRARLHRVQGRTDFPFQANSGVIRDFLDGSVRAASGQANSTGSEKKPFATHKVFSQS